MKRRRKRGRFAMVLLLLVFLALVADAWNELTSPLALQQEARVVVAPGAHLRSVLSAWEQQGILRSARQARYLGIYARVAGLDTAIKSGEFAIQPGMRPLDLTRLLVSGRGILHEIRIIEGWQFEDMLAAVLADPRLLHGPQPLSGESVMRALGQPDLDPEGQFFPDTYRFPRNSSDMALMRQAFEAQQKILAQAWKGRDPGIPLASPAEALILASIIERETGRPSERAEIAGVFARRLRLGMRLQTDPTVIYGLGAAFDGNLRRVDLQRDTPFNTYTRKGLPPTPICLPGRDAIHAAVHPASGETLYFVARGDGSHQFSASVGEHNSAVRKYQLRRKTP